ncbi:hypothetical protein LG293_17290 (plasmid) [Citricoccus nitrophenolicus]
MTTTPNRVAKGVSTGGQFAPDEKAEVSIALPRPALDPDTVVVRCTEALEVKQMADTIREDYPAAAAVRLSGLYEPEGIYWQFEAVLDASGHELAGGTAIEDYNDRGIIPSMTNQTLVNLEADDDDEAVLDFAGADSTYDQAAADYATVFGSAPAGRDELYERLDEIDGRETKDFMDRLSELDPDIASVAFRRTSQGDFEIDEAYDANGAPLGEPEWQEAGVDEPGTLNNRLSGGKGLLHRDGTVSEYPRGRA